VSHPLKMIVIYDRPHDAPDGYAVRAWDVRAGIVAPGAMLGSGLATICEARALVPPGLVNIGRMDGDDPKIVEVWL
jgi:hypothetical protein